MIQILYIGLGGFLGAISRFLVSKYAGILFTSIPLGTFLVNFIGTFVLGFINYSVLAGKNVSPDVRGFATIGFIGAFTTMSTFSYETFRLFELGEYTMFGLNLFINVGFCLTAVYLSRQAVIMLYK